MAELRVAVVGAGIGGLTAAIAMRANGIDATVYEQAHELKALGAGVSIATNGSRILNTLGVGAAVAAIAGPVTHYQFRTWQAEPIAGEPSALGFGDPATTWCLHRGGFQHLCSLAAFALTEQAPLSPRQRRPTRGKGLLTLRHSADSTHSRVRKRRRDLPLCRMTACCG